MAIVVTSVSPSTVYKREWNKRLEITGTGFTDDTLTVSFGDTEIEVLKSTYFSATVCLVDVNIPDTCTEAADTITVTVATGPTSGTSGNILTVAASVEPLSRPKPEEANGEYLPFIDNEGKAVQPQLDSSGRVKTATDLVVSDIEIGAVEIKNGTDDTRAVVKSDGVNNALVITANGVSTVTTGQANITDSATQIVAVSIGRKSLMVQNPSAAILYVGAAGVTITTGMAVPAHSTIGVGGFTGALFGVFAAAGPTTVTYIAL